MWSHDFRLAARALSRAPAFTIVALLTLAIGVGANTAIFSVIDTVLLRSAPVRDIDHLAVIWRPTGIRYHTRARIAPGLSRLQAARPAGRADRGVHGFGSQRRAAAGRADPAAGSRSHPRSAADAWYQPARWTRLRCQRNGARRPAGRRHRGGLLDTCARPRFDGDRTNPDPERSALHHRRHHAAQRRVRCVPDPVGC